MGESNCKAIKNNGEHCRAYPMKGEVYCFLHNPSMKKEIKSANSLGGKSKKNRISNKLAKLKVRNIKEVVFLIETTIDDLRSERIDIKVANSIGYLSTIALKALEISQIEERLNYLEQSNEY